MQYYATHSQPRKERDFTLIQGRVISTQWPKVAYLHVSKMEPPHLNQQCWHIQLHHCSQEVAALTALLTITQGWTSGYPCPICRECPVAPFSWPRLPWLLFTHLPTILLFFPLSLLPDTMNFQKGSREVKGSKQIPFKSKEPHREEIIALLDQISKLGLVWISIVCRMVNDGG